MGDANVHPGGTVSRGCHLGALPVRGHQQPGPSDQRVPRSRTPLGLAPKAAHHEPGHGRPHDDLCGDAAGHGVERDGAVVRGRRHVQAALLPQALRHAGVGLHSGGHQSGPPPCHPAPAGLSQCPPPQQEDAGVGLESESPPGLPTGWYCSGFIIALQRWLKQHGFGIAMSNIDKPSKVTS